MAKRKVERPKYFANGAPPRAILKREFVRSNRKEATEGLILSADLIKSSIFTRSQINSLVRDKVLTPTIYRSRMYFKKDDVLIGIKYLSEPPKLFLQ